MPAARGCPASRPAKIRPPSSCAGTLRARRSSSPPPSTPLLALGGACSAPDAFRGQWRHIFSCAHDVDAFGTGGLEEYIYVREGSTNASPYTRSLSLSPFIVWLMSFVHWTVRGERFEARTVQILQLHVAHTSCQVLNRYVELVALGSGSRSVYGRCFSLTRRRRCIWSCLVSNDSSPTRDRLTFTCSSALDAHTNTPVAIKKIADVFRNENASKRVYRELNLLMHLAHDNASLTRCCHSQ